MCRVISTIIICVIVAIPCSANEPATASGILSNPLDFSKGPVLPNVEPVTRASIEQSIQRGVAFLIEDQNSNGSWGSPTRTKALNIYAPVPGAHHAFRTATTALCVSALIETGSTDPKVMKALQRGEQWLLENLPRLRRATGDAIYNVWGHAYSIQSLVRMHKRHADDKALQVKITDLIKLQYEKLTKYASVDGGWGYYDFRYEARQPTSSSISFVNGTVLIAFAEAKEIGVPPPERVVKRAIAALLRQQKPDFTYLYGEYLQYQPMRGINRPGGSLGRSQCCNCALRYWGDQKITDNVVKNWLYRLYVRNGWLDIGRKRPVPHESWMQVAGYFYYYGHYYAGLSLELLPEDQQAPYQTMLAELMIDRQEKVRVKKKIN